jgi:septal ring factor EnvC (AmiA/AmiB activator)
MNRKRRIVWVCTAVVALSGCGNWTYQPPTASHPPETTKAPASDAAYLSKAAVKTEGQGGDVSSAVETALALSDKQAKLMDELIQTQQAKHELEESNRKLAGQSAKLAADLEEAQKELGEANQMLVEMKKELDAWKGNVLGFRDEIRKAQKAELDSLRKILVVLGADVPVAAAPATQPSTQPSDLQARAGS